MTVYYNECNREAVAWLRQLMAAGAIPQGVIDERDIRDVKPDDLVGFDQCHFFAGIGGWAEALRLADWTRPCWTGSCPCQPFSAAGRGAGFADERHLWPAWFHLIRVCRPDVVFGEQVDKADAWLDLVHDDLEAEGYAVGAADLPAACVGAPHRRQRLWFVADSRRVGWERGTRASGSLGENQAVGREGVSDVDGRGGARVVADSDEGRGGRHSGTVLGTEGKVERRVRRVTDGAEPRGDAGALADDHEGRRAVERAARLHEGRERRDDTAGRGADGAWDDCDWLPCRDGKWRPVEPGTFPLAHGIPARVGRLRGYGNAIVPQVAAEVIRAYRDAVAHL